MNALRKENLELKKENNCLKERVNSLSYILKHLQDKEKHAEEEKNSLITTISQYSELTVGPLSRATRRFVIIQFTGCHQPVQRSYWPENAIGWLA